MHLVHSEKLRHTDLKMTDTHIIELDRVGATYYSGETIKGSIRVLNDDTVVNWFGSSVILVENQILCSLERLWFYSYMSDNRSKKHYEFSLNIPHAFYSTSISICGKHSYYLKATVSCKDVDGIGCIDEDGFKDCIVYKDIIIVRPLTLQLYNSIYNNEWQIDFNPYIMFKMDHAAYVPGQTVHFVIGLLEKLRLKQIKVSIKQHVETVTDCYPVIEGDKIYNRDVIDSLTICSKTFNKGQVFRGTLELPRSIALSTRYPTYHTSLLYFRIVNVRYSVCVSLRRHLLRTIYLGGDELVVGAKPVPIDEEGVLLDSETEDPSNFCLNGDPNMVTYAYIPKPGIVIPEM